MHSIRLLALATALFASCASAQQFTAGDIVVDHPWARATPKGATVGAGYLTLRNNGSAADALAAIESDTAGSAQMHESKMDGGVMRMDEISSLSIPPGGAVIFKPGGYHVMFVDLKAPFRKGGHFSATLTFEHAGKVAVDFTIEGLGASAPAKSMEAMPGMEMK
jgi:periplasmic copper chaperone A